MRYFLGSLLMTTLASSAQADIQGPIPFGKTPEGHVVEAFELTGGRVKVKVISLGATIQSVQAPDRDGKLANVVLGFDDLAGYLSDANQHFGCTTGRVANRIAKGAFTLDGVEYKLALNNGPNHLHGGVKRSLGKVNWKGEIIGTGVRFTYSSPDGEEGYPGKLDLAVTYSLDERGRLSIGYTATTDKATPINLTNHSYFNLAGAGSESVLDHELAVAADQVTANDETLIPTGKLLPVAGTPLDFTKPAKLGARIDDLTKTPNLGYDHNFVLRDRAGLDFAAKLRDPKSGRTLTVFTTQPGIQVYSGNFLKGQKGAGDQTFKHRSAVCLETQDFPNAVNVPDFPSVIIRPGQTYRHTCVYAFGVE